MILVLNMGGVWDNVKKYIEVGVLEYVKSLGLKGLDVYKVVVIGDMVGDLLKDILGLLLNILIKLMVVELLVFVLFFVVNGGWLFR